MYLIYIKLAIICEYIVQLVRHTRTLYTRNTKNMQGFDYMIAKCKNVYAVVNHKIKLYLFVKYRKLPHFLTLNNFRN